ncbi:MAG: M28 family metallopeptidase [Spirochaetales bacterium]|nr:M28 family metallopeptidase [Spirochaetales bacterium]
MNNRAQKIIASTAQLIHRFGPRPPASSESRETADALADEIRHDADSTRVEDFHAHPGAFLGWIRVLVLFYVAGVALFWMGYSTITAFLMVFSLFVLVGEFFLYWEVLDPFYPRRKGRNLEASLNPEGEVRGELILSGHHDSAPIFTLLDRYPRLYPFLVNSGIASIGIMSLLSGLHSYGLNRWDFMEILTPYFSVLFTIQLLFVLPLWFFASRKHTPGAGDNLASSLVALDIIKSVARRRDEGNGLKHLKVTAVSWDAEEAGLRGSRAWCKGRKPSTHPVWNLNFECLYDANALTLLTTDVNGSVTLSKDLAKRCHYLLEQKLGRPAKVHPIAFLSGGTDAGETARCGMHSTTLVAMGWDHSTHSTAYHTPKDIPEAVDAKAVEASLELTELLIEELDEELMQLQAT